MLRTIFLVGLGIVPSLLWLWYFRIRDYKPEPRQTVFYFFIRGVLSAFIAFFFQWILNKYLNLRGDTFLIFGLPLYYVISGAFIEEVTKYGFFRFRIGKVKDLDDPVDAVIYLVSVAVGFAAVENIAIFLQSGTDQLLSIFLMRLISATLLHAITAAIIAYFYIQKYIKKDELSKGRHLLFVGLGLSIVLHSIYNLIIHFSSINTEVEYGIWLMALLLLFGILVASHLTVRLNRLKLKERN